MTRHTFNEAKERADQDGSEWQLGAVQADLALIPSHLRLRYSPDGVLQFNNVFDTNGCASRSILNIAEAKLNYFYDNGMHPDIKAWFDKQGFRVNGRFVLADAFIEILSGTTPQGNSLKAPVDALHRYGFIPASMLPLEDGMTWEEYMNPDRITAEMLRLGKETLRRIGWNYEQVPASNFLTELQKDFVDAAGHGWPTPKDGVYPRTDATIQHAFALAQDSIDALDNYTPFIKRLAKDFKFFDWGYSLSITRQTPFPDETVKLFEVLQQSGLLAFFATALEKFLNAMTNSKPESVTEPEPAPKPAPVPTPPPAVDEKLIAALIQVESGGDDNAIGDKHLTHKAYGCLQIRQPVCDDVNRAYSTKLRPQDMLGNRALSVQTFGRYMNIYALKSRLGRPVTDEDKARIWNGGPSAWNPKNKMHTATTGYWAKVKKLL